MPSRTTWYFLAPSLAVSALLLVLGLGGGWYVHRVNREVSDSLDDYLFDAQAAERLVIAIRDFRLELDRFADSGNRDFINTADVSAHTAQSNLDKIGTVGKINQNLPDFEQRLNQLRQLNERDARTQAQQMVAQIQADLLTDAETHLHDRQQIARDTSRRNRAASERIGVGLLLLGLCGSMAGLLAGYGIARSVNRSLIQLTVPVRDMAGTLNDVVGPITVSSNGELSQLDEALRGLAEKTAQVVGQLQDSQRQSLRNEQLAAVGQLAAGLAHELRNPLMSMKLIVQSTAEAQSLSAASLGSALSPVPSDAAPLSARDLTILDEEISRLERMLQTFLDFARPPRPAKEPTDLLLLVQSTIEVIQPRASQQDVTVHDVSAMPGAPILADAGQLRQVMLNLLINALDALPSGGNIWIKMNEQRAAALPTAVAPAERLVRVTVADDGPGIPAHVAERLFEPFVSTKVTGIGLGLSTCRRIIESHDGTLTAANGTSRGAEFTFILPLSEARN